MESQSKIAAVRQSGSYTEKNHRQWVDDHNSGVSHLGIPPENWLNESLAWDIFHGRSNYVKLQVRYMCKLLEGGYESIDSF